MNETLYASAVDAQGDYDALLSRRSAAEKVSAFGLLELLHDVYPDAPHPKKMQLANELAAKIAAEMGKLDDVDQSALLAASDRRDAAVRELAESITQEEAEALDSQARQHIRNLPETYDGPRSRRWLAEWLAKGLLV